LLKLLETQPCHRQQTGTIAVVNLVHLHLSVAKPISRSNNSVKPDSATPGQPCLILPLWILPHLAACRTAHSVTTARQINHQYG
jgi:hypothetical protein